MPAISVNTYARVPISCLAFPCRNANITHGHGPLRQRLPVHTPAEPESLAKLDISETVIEGLILRLMYMNSRMVAHEISAEIALPFYNIVEPILSSLKESRLIEITHGEMAGISYIYQITDAGRARALQYFEQTTYVGPRADLGQFVPAGHRRAEPAADHGARRPPARGVSAASFSTTRFSTRSARR